MCSVWREAFSRSAFWTWTLSLCKACTKAVSFVALSKKNVITGVAMCRVCTDALLCAVTGHKRHHRFGHVHKMYQSSRLRSTLNTDVISPLDMSRIRGKGYHTCGHVSGMYRSRPFHSSDSYGHCNFLKCREPFHALPKLRGLKSKNGRNTTTIYTACSN